MEKIINEISENLTIITNTLLVLPKMPEKENIIRWMRQTLEGNRPFTIGLRHGSIYKRRFPLCFVEDPLLLATLINILVGNYGHYLNYNKYSKILYFVENFSSLVFTEDDANQEIYFKVLPEQQIQFKSIPQLIYKMTDEQQAWIKEERWKARRMAIFVAYRRFNGRDYHVLKNITIFL